MKEFVNGIAWGEGLRWHNGFLYFSDIYGKKVYRAKNGEKEVVLAFDDMPSGLGFLPDDSLLIVSGGHKKVLRLKDGDLSVYADLSDKCVGLNDMVVDSAGNCYVGAYGFMMQFYKGGEANGWVFHISPNGEIHKVCDELQAPNGMAITPDGKTLIVADTFQRKLISFKISVNGIPSDGHIWAELPAGPDGICLDESGAVWAALPNVSKVARIEKGGKLLQEFNLSETPLCCTLGGENRRELFIVTVPAHNDLSLDELSDFDKQREKAASHILIEKVQVSGAGYP